MKLNPLAPSKWTGHIVAKAALHGLHDRTTAVVSRGWTAFAQYSATPTRPLCAANRPSSSRPGVRVTERSSVPIQRSGSSAPEHPDLGFRLGRVRRGSDLGRRDHLAVKLRSAATIILAAVVPLPCIPGFRRFPTLFKKSGAPPPSKKIAVATVGKGAVQNACCCLKMRLAISERLLAMSRFTMTGQEMQWIRLSGSARHPWSL